ncbi:hypothetical protein A0H81_05766 [Grifola frondosa]|uniref:Major facilitator superfamily (MFS) profile domain-containing protein n=1 Tax=Grifola frondosa TaxID=5627 RepID=A0A1C7MD88_GRIFR|nr:hypothetical protein A0H81_05766 [Grifola frondosa]
MSSEQIEEKSVDRTSAAASPVVDVALPSGLRRYTILFVLCLAQFIDSYNNTAIVTAIPPISQDLSISNSESVWLLSGYQITLAAFLLSSGRLSDLYSPKWIFVVGTLLMSFCALGAGFVRSEIPLVVLRAFMGIGAAMNIPSAMSLIIKLFPEPAAQSQALAAFVFISGVGNVLGLIMGALFVSFANWTWVFYFATITAFIAVIAILLLLPSSANLEDAKTEEDYKRKLLRLDPIGVSSMTIALILFVFAVTSGSIRGWDTAQVIAPLVLSIVLIIFFGFWETRMPVGFAAIPLSMWRYPDFTILIIVSLYPFMWWASVQMLLSWLYQEVYGWSTIIAAVHFLPLGLVSFVMVVVSSALQRRFPLKLVILLGQVLALAGSVILPFASSKERYWSFTFPGFVLGSAGTVIIFTTTNIALFTITPPEVAGVVGAIYTCALQIGSTAGPAIVTSIQTSVQITHGGPGGFAGRAAGFWFLFAFGVAEMVGVLVFMHHKVPPKSTGGQVA